MAIKRKREALSPEQKDLALFSGLVQSQRPLQCTLSHGRVSVACGDVVIAVPKRFAIRCQLLQEAPEGNFSEDVSTFLFWLEHEWDRDMELSEASQKRAPAERNDDDIADTFELLKACDYLRDSAGVAWYIQEVYALLLASPVACQLSFLQRAHYTEDRCSPAIRHLADLPSNLAREMLKINPVRVLDRLPYRSRIGRLCCETFNEWVTQRKQAGALVPTWSSSPRWIWRSAVAEQAQMPLRVRATLDEYTSHIRSDYPGLSAFDVGMGFDAGPLSSLALELPQGVEELRLDCACSARTCEGLILPSSLRNIALRFSSGTVRPRPLPLLLAGLQLPERLETFEINASVVSISGVKLPHHLTALVIKGRQDGEYADVCLPASLKRLELHCSSAAQGGLSGLRLPPGLLDLYVVDDSDNDSEVQLTSLLASLTRLRFDAIGVDSAHGFNVALPPGLRHLELCQGVGGDVRVSGPELPQQLTALKLYQVLLTHDALPPSLQALHLETDSLIGRPPVRLPAELPASITSLYLQNADLGPDLSLAPWPPSLKRLELRSLICQSHLSPQRLPPALQELELSDLDLTFCGVQFPASLSALSMDSVRLKEDCWTDVTWPESSLKRVDIDLVNVGSFMGLFAVIPDSVTYLSLPGVNYSNERFDLLRLPLSLKEFHMTEADFGPTGLSCLQLPGGLTSLALSGKLGPRGYADFELPDTIESATLICRIMSKEEGSTDACAPASWPQGLKRLKMLLGDDDALKNTCRLLPPSLTRLAVAGPRLTREGVDSILAEHGLCGVSVKLEAYYPYYSPLRGLLPDVDIDSDDE